MTGSLPSATAAPAFLPASSCRALAEDWPLWLCVSLGRRGGAHWPGGSLESGQGAGRADGRDTATTATAEAPEAAQAARAPRTTPATTATAEGRQKSAGSTPIGYSAHKQSATVLLAAHRLPRTDQGEHAGQQRAPLRGERAANWPSLAIGHEP